jgi:hypothetical protein
MFAIPAGFVATSGTWNITSNISGWTGGSYTNKFEIGTDTATETSSGNGAFNYALAVTTAQLADINAAAGTNLAVNFVGAPIPLLNQSVTACTLILIGSITPPSTGYPNPEWGYGFQVATPLTAINLSTPQGGVGISNSGTNAVPAALTSVFNFTATSEEEVTQFIADITYAGQYISISVDTSSDGVTWATQDTANIGSNHTGTFSSEQITYTFPSALTSAYLRISFQELPQVGDPSLMRINTLVIDDSNMLPIPVGSGYCNNTGSFDIAGVLAYGTHASPGTPRENFPLTIFVKQCTNPFLMPCAHSSGTGVYGEGCNPYPDCMYCSDGVVSAQYTMTDCSGNFSVSLSGAILSMGIALGTWVMNPAFSCSAPNPICTGSNPAYNDPFFEYIPDAATLNWLTQCGGELDVDGFATGTAIGILSCTGCAGGVTSASGAGVSDESVNTPYACGTYNPASFFSCYSGQGIFYSASVNGVTYNAGTGAYIANTLTGSYTLNVWSGCGSLTPYVYFEKDGLYYQITGVYLTFTDSCGNTYTNLPTYSNTGFDWTQFVSVAVSNWTTDCNPPIGTPFTGPLGGTLLISVGTTGPSPPINSNVYPTYDGVLPTLCPQICPVVGIQVQSPCLSTTGEVMAADAMHDVLALTWINSTGSLYTAINRQATQKKLRTYGSELWNTSYQVESANTADVGMCFLPNESLYLTYELSGTPVYRLNQLLGTEGHWSGTNTPSPLTSLLSDGGRAQGQSYRIQATGSQTVDNVLQFSQCRDNTGATWTNPVTLTASPVIPSSPATWSGNQSLTFAIPSGITATSGYWNLTSTITGWTSGMYSDTFTTSVGVSQSGSGNGAFTYQLALSVGQISDVNAAAGGNLSVTFTLTGGVTQSVTACELVLPGAFTLMGQGPYAGIIYSGNAYSVVYSSAQTAPGRVATGIYSTFSTDGGATWSMPAFITLGGQCNGICATSQNNYRAILISDTAVGGRYATSLLQGGVITTGVGWSVLSATFANPVPGLSTPACIASFKDNVFIIWVSGNTPQYVYSTDGGFTFY